MRIVMFYHSVLSDWNHGNAHFLRGVATELLARGHDVLIYEPCDAWSVQNLLQEQGESAIAKFHATYPTLRLIRYDLSSLDLNPTLRDADLVIVHEWNDPKLVARIGEHRKLHDHYILFFHDTHHRSVTAHRAMADYDLRHYDAALVYGASIGKVYLYYGWAKNICVWHEAADTRVFHPIRQLFDIEIHNENGTHSRATDPPTYTGAKPSYEGDLVWIGNWGDEERAEEIQEFLIGPVKELGLRARVYGVRYPSSAIEKLAAAGIEYAGWLPNFEVPQIFSRFRATVHIPRRPYVHTLSGIPTIRPFEAMACGIPLVSAFWNDAENLFTPGKDYRVARNGKEMKSHLQNLLNNPEDALALAQQGYRTILKKHTCAHRVDELLIFYKSFLSIPQEMQLWPV